MRNSNSFETFDVNEIDSLKIETHKILLDFILIETECCMSSISLF